jgi:hypothetical protein
VCIVESRKITRYMQTTLATREKGVVHLYDGDEPHLSDDAFFIGGRTLLEKKR